MKKENAFAAFGLKPLILQAIENLGFTTPSPIQEQAIPLVLEGRDLIGQAHTGTGKTAAFGIPCLQQMKGQAGVELLVITPTRELATQVSDEIARLGSCLGVRTGVICGGNSFGRQKELVRKGAQVVVATPGRLLDLLESGSLGRFEPSMVVLDEADEMLDMGFLEDIQKIFTYLPDERQTLLFSATMPPAIRKLAQTILKNPAHVSLVTEEATSQNVQQLCCVVQDSEREDALARLIDMHLPQKAIVFCRTKKEVDRLSTVLTSRGYTAQALHGDMEQPQRQRAITRFREGEATILVATDVASRGLNVPEISHVFNYHLPFDAQSYVHRIGRTGRAGAKGISITLATPGEYRALQRFARELEAKVETVFVPTLQQLSQRRSDDLIDLIKQQEITADAEAMVQTLSTEFDLFELGSKLAAYLLGQQKNSGPEKIGFDAQALKNLMQAKPFHNKRQKQGSRPPFRKRFGRYRKGSKHP